MTYIKYKIFCITENTWKYWILPDTDPVPTTCPEDPTHTVNPDSVAVVETIDPNPKTVNVMEQPPFAQPTYRTKWNATPSVISVDANTTEIVDFVMPEELYCHGGQVIFEGVQLGDWIEAFITDDETTPVIPEAYRAALCEAWPVVAAYVHQHYLTPGSGKAELNTYPLNAKITAGLILRVKVHTSTAVGTRKFAMNYFLTKKLDVVV